MPATSGRSTLPAFCWSLRMYASCGYDAGPFGSAAAWFGFRAVLVSVAATNSANVSWSDVWGLMSDG